MTMNMIFWIVILVFLLSLIFVNIPKKPVKLARVGIIVTIILSLLIIIKLFSTGQ